MMLVRLASAQGWARTVLLVRVSQRGSRAPRMGGCLVCARQKGNGTQARSEGPSIAIETISRTTISPPQLRSSCQSQSGGAEVWTRPAKGSIFGVPRFAAGKVVEDEPDSCRSVPWWEPTGGWRPRIRTLLEYSRQQLPKASDRSESGGKQCEAMRSNAVDWAHEALVGYRRW
jgi:hypothetical protein